ncbi:MAG: hypothetical protein GY903_11130 [Fuerstiella sp.]|nr:hypothetical protein [Fuerstiella sp.]MCP4855034.1 hypothetical protein [Fuerstiella sp.]
MKSPPSGFLQKIPILWHGPAELWPATRTATPGITSSVGSTFHHSNGILFREVVTSPRGKGFLSVKTISQVVEQFTYLS